MMMRNSGRITKAVLCILGMALVLPAAAEGQRRGRQGPAAPQWVPISVGLHVGYDDNASGEVAGVQLRIPIVRSGRIELMPNADVTFLRGLKAYQFNLDAVFVFGGRAGGPYVGGGLGYRNSVFGVSPASPREVKRGYTAVAGVKSAGIGVSFSTQLEIRWVFLKDSPIDPRMITLGVNFPLWGRESRAEGGSDR